MDIKIVQNYVFSLMCSVKSESISNLFFQSYVGILQWKLSGMCLSIEKISVHDAHSMTANMMIVGFDPNTEEGEGPLCCPV